MEVQRDSSIKETVSRSLEPIRTRGSGASSTKRGGTPTHEPPCKFPPINPTSKSMINPTPVYTEDSDSLIPEEARGGPNFSALQPRVRNPNKRSTAPMQIKRKEFTTVAVSIIKSCEDFDVSEQSQPLSKVVSIEMTIDVMEPVDELPNLASGNFLSHPSSPIGTGDRPMSFGGKGLSRKSLLPPQVLGRQCLEEQVSETEGGGGSQRLVDTHGKNFHDYQMEQKTQILLNASGILGIEGFSSGRSIAVSSRSILACTQGLGLLAMPGESPFKKSGHAMHGSMIKKVKNSQNAY
jgi:hypothetical protein